MKRDPLRPVMWKVILLIAASQFYLFWALLAAFLLFAILALPGSILIATWWMLWKETKGVREGTVSTQQHPAAGKSAAETVGTR